jgi:heat shock protein HslJ
MKKTASRADFHPRMTAAALLCLLAGCAQEDGAPQAREAPVAPQMPPTRTELLTAEVSGIFPHAVALQDGRYDGPPAEPGAAARPTLLLWSPTIEFGDIDGSDGNEAVAMLSSSAGGSGDLVHVGIFTNKDGKARSIAVTPVGDRVKLIRMWLEPGKVFMDVVEAGAKDPACCPTRIARKEFHWLPDGELKLIGSDAISVLSVNLLAATDWMLIAMDGEAVPEGAMPPTALIEYGKIAGFAGCNRYTGQLAETDPGTLQVGALVATRKACAPPATQLEQQFLERLGRIDRYTLQAGQLLLTGPGQAGASSSLLFAR